MSFVVLLESHPREVDSIPCNWFWLCNEEWVSATGSRAWDYYDDEDDCVPEDVPDDVMVFDTQDAAIDFMTAWQGHPYWVRPTGSFNVYAYTPKKTTAAGVQLVREVVP